MKVRKRTVIETAVKWKGWPHKVKGLEDHPVYSQMGYVYGPTGGQSVYPGDFVVTDKDGFRVSYRPDDFEKLYQRI